MAVPGYLATPRGVVNKYIYHRTDLAYTDPDKIHNSEATGEQGSNSLDGIIQATLNAYNAAYGKTVGGKVLSYNPITDGYDIRNGEYVL
jgi:hypothetical protein